MNILNYAILCYKPISVENIFFSYANKIFLVYVVKLYNLNAIIRKIYPTWYIYYKTQCKCNIANILYQECENEIISKNQAEDL